MVFDGSAKTTGVSLNDAQKVGPIEQSELFTILLRFRRHTYVLTADIEKMYRQIFISPEDRKYQRIFWRSHSSNCLKCFEVFYTVLTQIETVLNSHPISPLSHDPNGLNTLTPGHFLIERVLTSITDPDVTDTNETKLSRYQHLKKLAQHFWNRWSKEYITELQTRTK